MITIIYISKGKIVGCRVDEGKQIVKSSFELGWDTNTFDISLSQLIEKLKNKKIRILLDDSFSYVLRFAVPKDLNAPEERKFISDRIAEKIPEFLSDKDWDYKEIQFSLSRKSDDVSLKEKEVVVFSPVKYVSDILSKAVSNLGLEVEAIEPVEIALTRNTNPVIGIALKKDLNGSDREVLNIVIDKGRKDEDFKDILVPHPPEKPSPETASSVTTDYNPDLSLNEDKHGRKKIVITIFLFLIIIIFVSILAFLAYRDFFSKKSSGNGPAATVTPAETPAVTIVPTLVPEAESPIDYSQYKVMVKNGSGIKGEAQNAVALLEEIGLTQFETANADSYDYIKTEVAVREGFSEKALDELIDTLGQEYDVATDSAVLKDSEYDVEIVVGIKI